MLWQKQDLISIHFHGASMDLNSPSSTYASLPSQLFFQHPLCSCMHSQSLRLLWQKNPTKPQNPQSLLSLLLEVFLSRGEKERLRNSSGPFPTQGCFASTSSCIRHCSLSWNRLSLIISSRVSSLPASLLSLASSPALDARSLQREQLFEPSNRVLAPVVVCWTPP